MRGGPISTTPRVMSASIVTTAPVVCVASSQEAVPAVTENVAVVGPVAARMQSDDADVLLHASRSPGWSAG